MSDSRPILGRTLGVMLADALGINDPYVYSIELAANASGMAELTVRRFVTEAEANTLVRLIQVERFQLHQVADTPLTNLHDFNAAGICRRCLISFSEFERSKRTTICEPIKPEKKQ